MGDELLGLLFVFIAFAAVAAVMQAWLGVAMIVALAVAWAVVFGLCVWESKLRRGNKS